MNKVRTTFEVRKGKWCEQPSKVKIENTGAETSRIPTLKTITVKVCYE